MAQVRVVLSGRKFTREVVRSLKARNSTGKGGAKWEMVYL